MLPTLALGLFALAPSSALAAPVATTVAVEEGAPVTVEVREFFENSPRSGWVPLAVQITNRSSAARSWTLTLETSQGIQACHLGEWRFEVPGGEQKEFTVFAPLPWPPRRGNYFQVTGHFSGPWISGTGQVWFNRRFSGYPETLFTGMSSRLAAENWSRLEAELQGSPAVPTISTALAPTPSRTTPAVHLAGTTFDPNDVPPDWRSYSGLATIWLHRDDWIELTAAKRLALVRWVAQGGALYIAGLGPGLNDLPPTGDMRFVGDALWQSGSYGLGSITRLPFEDESPGSSRKTEQPQSIRLPIAEVAKIISSEDSGPMASEPEGGPATALESAVGKIRTNGLLLGTVVAAIGILLGPVNLFLLAPVRKRARLFITVPIIAAGGALALVAIILMQDGTGGRGHRAVLVALTPDRAEALVWQEQSVLTGLLIGRTFDLPEDASFNDLSPAEATNRYGPPNYRPWRSGLDRDGAHLSGDWFTSRTIHSHHLREFIPTRASLTLELDDQERLCVVSTCPDTLREVYIVDRERKVWWAGQVPRGQRIVLTERRGPPKNISAEIRKYFPRLTDSDAVKLEEPLTFQAIADHWDASVPAPTLRSINWVDDRIFIVGPVRATREVEP